MAHPDANIIFGAVVDDALGEEVRVTSWPPASTSSPHLRRRAPAASRAGCPACWRNPSAAGTSEDALPSILADDVDEDMDVFTNANDPEPATVSFDAEEDLDIPDFLKN